jgi:glucose/arabinose dehydrogenase
VIEMRRPTLPVVLSLCLLAAPPAPASPASADRAQVRTRPLAPKRYHVAVDRLPKPFAVRSVMFRPKVVPPPRNATLAVPEGFRVTVAATGLDRPRRIAVALNGDVFVTESLRHRVIALRDTDGDGTLDRKTVFASGLHYPFGLAFQGGHLYVANTGSVVRFPYKPGQTVARGKPQVVARGIPERGYNQHWTRDILFSPDGRKLYVTVGSQGNVGEEPPPRATILEMSADGKNRRVYASGLRNPVSIAWNPLTGALWCTNNERDYRGDELVPDFVTSVAPGGFYGWPWYYLGPHRDPHMPEKPAMKKRVIVPDVLLQAHSAPLGLLFYTGRQFPPEYQGDAFVALHGSTNTRERTGYKIVRLRMRDGRPLEGYEDFLTGWMLHPRRREVWGRPVGLAQAPDGSLLITEDGNGRVYRVSYRK